MKKHMLTFLLLSAFGIPGYAQAIQTEEYAIVYVFDSGGKKSIVVTEGDKLPVEKATKRKEDLGEGDFSMVIKELNDLNKKGFELLSSNSASYTDWNLNGNAYSESLRSIFIMVKRTE